MRWKQHPQISSLGPDGGATLAAALRVVVRSSHAPTLKNMKNFSRFMQMRTFYSLRQRIAIRYNKVPPYLFGESRIPGFIYSAVKSFPEKKNWFELGAVTPPRDQGPFGNCSAFAVAAAMESADHLFGSRELRVLSPQELIDYEYYGQGIFGGCTLSSFDHITARGGLCAESDYPYMGAHIPSPTFKLPRYGTGVIGYQIVPSDDVISFKKALSNQPLVCSMVMFDAFPNHDGDEMFASKYTELNDNLDNELKKHEEMHSMLAIGYDSDHIRFKNSWGSEWVDEGFINVEINAAISCGLLSRCWFPVFDELLESSAIKNSCGQIGDVPKKNGSPTPTITLLHEKEPQRMKKLAPASEVLWMETIGFGVEEEGS